MQKINQAKVILTTIILLVVFIYSANAQELSKEGRYYVAEITKSFNVKPGGLLHMSETTGDVKIETWNKNEVFVKELKKMEVYTREEAEAILQESKSSYHLRGNTIEIGGKYHHRQWIRSDFLIKLPTTFNVEVKTRGGDIGISKLNGNVDLKTSGGDISLIDIDGLVGAKTSGGDIEAFNTKGFTELHTSGGDIKVNNIGGDLDASTSGGDIEGEMFEGNTTVFTSGGSIDLKKVNGAVHGQTSGGDISVEVTLTDFTKDHKMHLRSAGGDLTLYLPERLPATIRAEIEIHGRWDDYNIYSDFPLSTKTDTSAGKERKRRNRRRYVRSEGDINGGGDLIELYTNEGDIYIKKLKK